MMHGELVHRRAIEFTRASAADPRVDLERALAVAVVALVLRPSCLEDEAIEAGMIDGLAGRGHDVVERDSNACRRL